MRHVIVGKDVAGPFTSAAAGALVMLYKDANGEPALVQNSVLAGIKAADTEIKFGVLKEAASVSLALLNESEWVLPSDVVKSNNFYPRAYVAAVDQVIKHNFSAAAAAATDECSFKLIFSDTGFERFDTSGFQFLMGATVDTAATNLAAAINAQILVGGCPKVASAAVYGSDASQVNITLAAGARASVAFDAQGSTAAMESVAGTAFAFGHGTYDEVVKKEKEQLGRDVGNYDRYTALPAEEVLNAVVGGTYHSYAFTLGNKAQGQIRGVDNMRSYQLYFPKGGSAYLDGENGTEHTGTEEELASFFIGLGAVDWAELG